MKIKFFKKIKNKFYQYKIKSNKFIHIDLKSSRPIKIIIAMTCFNEIEYTLNALESLKKYTLNNNNFKFNFLLLDDFSSDKTQEICSKIPWIKYYRENSQKGVNNLWNMAYELSVNNDYLILVNNDVKFSKDWADNIIYEMIDSKSVAGSPITNAPGHRNIQNIRNYIRNYIVSDNDGQIKIISDKIKNIDSFNYHSINGFCMAFNRKWLETLNKPLFESPDPNFQGEDIFFKRYPCNPLIIPSSFVFHYKQVSVDRSNWKNQQYRK